MPTFGRPTITTVGVSCGMSFIIPTAGTRSGTRGYRRGASDQPQFRCDTASFMRKSLLLAVCLLSCLVTSACQAGNQVSGLKVLIGATAIMQAGANPVEDTVIVISGSTIRAAGIRKDVPIPQDSERTDLTGKWVVPVAGGRIAPGEPADLFILNAGPNGSPAIGAPGRRMVHGQWN